MSTTNIPNGYAKVRPRIAASRGEKISAQALRRFAGELSSIHGGVPEKFRLSISEIILNALTDAFNAEAAEQGLPESAVLRMVKPDRSAGLNDNDLSSLASGARVDFNIRGLPLSKVCGDLFRHGLTVAVDSPDFTSHVQETSGCIRILVNCHCVSPSLVAHEVVTRDADTSVGDAPGVPVSLSRDTPGETLGGSA